MRRQSVEVQQFGQDEAERRNESAVERPVLTIAGRALDGGVVGAHRRESGIPQEACHRFRRRQAGKSVACSGHVFARSLAGALGLFFPHLQWNDKATA